MIKSYQVRFLAEAAEELTEAANWYEEQRRGLGSAFLMYIEAGLAKIKRDPELFPIIENNIKIKNIPITKNSQNRSGFDNSGIS